MRGQEKPSESVVIANLKFSLFVDPNETSPQCSVSVALKHVSEKERRRLYVSINEWIDSSPELASRRSPTSTLSPAALAIFYLRSQNRSFRPLVLELRANPSCAELEISLPSSVIPTYPTELVRGSQVLQVIFWHYFRISKSKPSSNTAFEIKKCGFIGCNGACCPQPRSKRLDFHLDRVYHKHTRNTRETEAKIQSRRTARLDLSVSNSPLLSLPDDVLFRIVKDLKGTDITHLSETCPAFFEFLLPIVPGLRLRLFPHQLHALNRLTAMEKLHIREDTMPLLERINTFDRNGSCLVVDLVDGSISLLDGVPCVGPAPGGLFCDEPGLGKTITALALILKTSGHYPSIVGKPIHTIKWKGGSVARLYMEEAVERLQSYGQNTTKFPDRKSRLLPDVHRQRSSSRNIRHTDYLGLGRSDALPSAHNCTTAPIFLSSATLIIVPTVLVAHWVSQIGQHVEEGRLRILRIQSRHECPGVAAHIANDFDVVLISFDAIRSIHMDMRSSAPPLMQVHFLRIIVDEGHSLSSASTTNFLTVCERLRAQIRWVMTGTPTPSTPRSDVDHLFSFLRFIREEAYGMDRSAWEVGVRTPYSNFKIESLERLESILRRVMIRGDKNVLNVECKIRNTVIDFSKPSAKSYNGLVRAVRRNLITSDWFSASHEESLLNPKNYRQAEELFKNLKLACCFGGTMDMSFLETDITETLDVIYEEYRHLANVHESDRFPDSTVKLGLLEVEGHYDDEEKAEVRKCEEMRMKLLDAGKSYTRLPRTKKDALSGTTTVETTIYAGRLHQIAEAFLNVSCSCDCCGLVTEVPMVTPCGHLLCDECIVLNKAKCVANDCGTEYYLDRNGVPEQLIELQPSVFSKGEWVRDWEKTESAKIEYLIKRIEGLPFNEEWESDCAEPKKVAPKVIVHSEYGDHLKMVAVKLKESRLKDAYVEMTWNETEREVGLKGRGAAEIAINSVERFQKDENVQILLMNTKHGGVGLDLSFVQYIFLLEPIWDASKELQIISRAHRIGCKRSILVERLVMRGSVEEAMLRNTKSVLRTSEINVSGVATARLEEDRKRRVRLLQTLQIVMSKEEIDCKGPVKSTDGGSEDGTAIMEKGSSTRNKRKSNSVDEGFEGENKQRRRVMFAD